VKLRHKVGEMKTYQEEEKERKQSKKISHFED